MMRKALLVAVVATLALTGCTADGTPAADQVSPIRSSTPIATPTVHTMSVVEAGKYYVATVCPANKAGTAYSAAAAAQDLASIQQTAAIARDAYRTEVAAFTKSDVFWPSVVSAADMKLITDSDFSAISTFEGIASAPSLEAANAMSNSFVDNGAGAAAQRIRLALNLPADTSANC